jgi:2-iminobutanoate/2-iminopropanoate deaminase
MRRLIAAVTLATSTALALQPASADELVHMAPPGSMGDLPFSEAVIYDDFIFLSGQLGIDPATGKLVEGGIGPETRQTLENIQATLERAGASMNDVIKCTVFMADISEWADMNKEYVTFFDKKPARSALGTGNGIALGARTEIECIAAAPEEDEDEEENEASVEKEIEVEVEEDDGETKVTVTIMGGGGHESHHEDDHHEDGHHEDGHHEDGHHED